MSRIRNFYRYPCPRRSGLSSNRSCGKPPKRFSLRIVSRDSLFVSRWLALSNEQESALEFGAEVARFASDLHRFRSFAS